MQPDQQNNQSSNQLPYQVPDYLQLDPVTGQVRKPSFKLKLIAIIVTLAVVVIALVSGLFMWMQNQIDQRLYDALSNIMSSSYIARKITMSSTSHNMNLSAQAESDCTNPLMCKSKFDYEYSDKLLAAQDGTPGKTNGEEIITSDDTYFSRVTSTSSVLTGKVFQPNQWYKITDQTNGGTFRVAGINSYQGAILTGNIDAPVRAQLMDYIKANKVYAIAKSQNDTINGQAATVYTIQTTMKKLSDLNAKAIDLFKDGSTNTFFDNGETVEMQISVADSSNKVLRIYFKQQQAGGATSVMQTDFTYPPSVSITAPQQAREFGQ